MDSMLNSREWPGLMHELMNEPEAEAVHATVIDWIVERLEQLEGGMVRFAGATGKMAWQQLVAGSGVW